MSRRVGSAAAVLAALLAAGCSDHGRDPAAPADGGGGTEPAVSYAADVQPLWNAHCVGCHGQVDNGGLDLRATASWAELVGVDAAGWPGQRVVPGDAAASVLYRKLTGDPTTGARMPQGGALAAAQIERVRRWIDAGARDD